MDNRHILLNIKGKGMVYMSERFNSMLYGVNDKLRDVLYSIPSAVKQSTAEIRIRRGSPLSLTVTGETVFVKNNGQTSFDAGCGLITVTEKDVDECYRLLCSNSVFAHEEELKNGYIRLKNGSRAGVFGSINAEGKISEISSINIRIAREIQGAASGIVKYYRGEGWLIAGPPGCGKTTVLRDFIRQISWGFAEKIYRAAVIDSRGELWGNGANDLGPATDILNIGDKAAGIEIALRTMFPEVIAFDEIGTTEELKRVKESFNAGVSIITTAHTGNWQEMLKRDVTRELLMSGAINRVALLSKMQGGEIKISTAEELLNADI